MTYKQIKQIAISYANYMDHGTDHIGNVIEFFDEWATGPGKELMISSLTFYSSIEEIHCEKK